MLSTSATTRARLITVTPAVLGTSAVQHIASLQCCQLKQRSPSDLGGNEGFNVVDGIGEPI
jgi:hypothetical protein